MTTYTVVIEASDENNAVWQALEPAETVDDDGTAAEVAAWTAQNQNIVDRGPWRVRVWIGNDADTGSQPDAEYVRPESEIMQELLHDIATEATALAQHIARRNELIQAAMRTDLSRDEIARAADLSVPRLYQIRDGRR